jgi:uncharacterized 2Fe-2S/4Fe-4S cluster protein (DUF4445 family)
MLGLHPTTILSLALTLLVNTITASSGGKGSCNKCQTKLYDCMLVSMQCACKIANEAAYCEDSCGIAGLESGCPDS